MLAHLLAAEFTLDRPQSPLGWLALILAGAALTWILTRGTYTLLGSFHDHFRPIFYFVLAATIILFFQQVKEEKKDPLLQGDIEVFVVEGVEATTDPGHDGD